jgi:hypothetical protein
MRQSIDDFPLLAVPKVAAEVVGAKGIGIRDFSRLLRQIVEPPFGARAAQGTASVASSPPLPARRDHATPKRVRRPTVAQIERETGRPVTALTVAPDGSKRFEFGQSEAAKEATAASADDNELDKWLLRHPEHARSPERH